MRRLSFPAILGVAPRFNITPSADIPIVLSLDGAPATWVAKWGLVPGWAKDATVGNKLAMARGESAREKPSFRDAIKRRRALMPADLFYEWQQNPEGKGAVPWCVRKTDDEPFFMGALWEQWTPKDNPGATPLLTCCVITTDANEWLQPIQDRMPLLIDADDCARWLDPKTPADEVQSFMVPRAANDLYSYRVSNWVNAPAHDDARCVMPISEADALLDAEVRTPLKRAKSTKTSDQLDVFG